MNPEGPPPLTAEESAALSRFIAQSGLSFEYVVNVGLKGIAASLIANHGQITLPLKIGLPSPVCHTCPVANSAQQQQPLQQPQANVLTFPRH